MDALLVLPGQLADEALGSAPIAEALTKTVSAQAVSGGEGQAMLGL